MYIRVFLYVCLHLQVCECTQGQEEEIRAPEAGCKRHFVLPNRETAE